MSNFLMNNFELIIGLIGTAISSGFVTNFFTRRKYNVDVKSDEIENLKKALEFYEKYVQDSNSRLESYIRRSEDDRLELYKLQDTIQYLLKISCTDKECSDRKYIPISEIETKVTRRKQQLDKPPSIEIESPK